MKIAVIGSRGQLGRDLCPRLAGDVLALTRDMIDLEKPETIRTALQAHRPNLVINTAAYNFVDKAEDDPQVAFQVNAWGVRELAHTCREIEAKLVHFSTDYVFGFSADRRTPWSETDCPGPVSVYGMSKLAGEYFVHRASAENLVIRTCGLYGVWGSGGKGGNFIETMIKRATQGLPLRVVNDQYCTPTYTVDLAETTIRLVQANAQGLYHITNSGQCTWYELAAETFQQAGLTANLTPITTAEYPTAARRPPFSVLSTEKLRSVGVTRPRQWRDALKAYLDERAQKQTQH